MRLGGASSRRGNLRLPPGQVSFSRVRALCVVVLVFCSVSACETEAQRARNAELQRPAAQEMNRICALRGDERAAELRKLKEQTGLELFCPQD